ncbi:ribokinase [Starkeya sp. 3C]|uniref:Ribokinase n=1 Tax=Ancylobacter moscoviensis TaxID=2597768 RepID=A0ABY3DM11_9HYPH|nr:ribokinase [Ancylobacter moscoviensis]TSJ60252.1 ribokinase [Ancylobacter moscoviensis]
MTTPAQRPRILVFGSINMDLVASVATIPRPGETVLSAGYRTLYGGKGANQAVAAARIGGSVAMIGRVGRDAFGEACRANLAGNGVTTDHIAAGEEPTGCAFITVDATGENAITVASGANGSVRAGDLPDALVDGETVAVMQMEVPLSASLSAARRVKAAGGRVVWNLAPAPADLTASDLTDLLSVTDIFIVNEIEALMAAARLGAPADIEDAARLLAGRGNVTCVVTAGSAGAIAHDAQGTRLHAPALPVKPVDTTGAGDTFVGILAAELAGHSELGNALGLACAGASLACLSQGAQNGMPTRHELNDFLTGSR